MVQDEEWHIVIMFHKWLAQHGWDSKVTNLMYKTGGRYKLKTTPEPTKIQKQ